MDMIQSIVHTDILEHGTIACIDSQDGMALGKNIPKDNFHNA